MISLRSTLVLLGLSCLILLPLEFAEARRHSNYNKHVSTTLPTTTSLSTTSSKTTLQKQQKKQRLPLTAGLTRVENDDDDDDVSVSTSAVEIRGGEQSSSPSSGLIKRLKIGSYFGLWYFLNVVYNIINKRVLNELPAPLSIGSIQFAVGGLYSLFLWMTRLRETPKISPNGRSACLVIGMCHCLGQLCSMISLGAGPVSFTHIVKALEPFFSAMVSALVFRKWMRPQVYATLLPVVGGVGYACLKERSFSWISFYAAMASNLLFAMRAVYSKNAMGGESISSANLFGVVTWVAFFVSVPAAVFREKTVIFDLWKQATATGARTPPELARMVLISGLFHYLNNEVMYMALSQVHPVTLAVGNTMKRVFIMVASVLVFRNPVSVQAGIGSAVGISGVLFYSLVKQYYEKLEAQHLQQMLAGGSKKKGRAPAVKKAVGTNKTTKTTARKRTTSRSRRNN